MACCATCPCHAEPGLLCLSVVNPRVYGYFAERCRLDESTERNRVLRRSVLDRSRIAFSSADELRKVLAPISGGAGGGCNCNCGKICWTCAGPTGTTVTVSQGGTDLWTGTEPIAGACTPALFGAGVYDIRFERAGRTTLSYTTTALTGACDSKTTNGSLFEGPTFDPIADQTISHLGPAINVTVTGVRASLDKALTVLANTSPCPSATGDPGTLSFQASSNSVSIFTIAVTYTSPNNTMTLTLTPGGFVGGPFLATVTLSQSNMSGITGCCVVSKVRTFLVTAT